MSEKIVLIDGHSILNRAFFGIPDLTNSEGLHTNAVYGFLNIMFRILDEESPQYLAVAFDVHAPTFRHRMYKEYKGTRKPMAPELREQVPLIKEVLHAMEIPTFEKAGYEADDILGTIARRGEEEGLEVVIVSGDRDLLQLATDHTKIRIPKTKRTGTEIEDYYAADVKERYQVTPREFIDVKALMGDSSDNIPGVPGIGEKTAINLIAAYHSIENTFDHLEEVRPPRAKNALREHYDMAQMSKELARIDRGADIEFSLADARMGELCTPEAYLVMKRLEFKNILARFQTKTPVNQAEQYFQTITDLAEAEAFFEEAMSLLRGKAGAAEKEPAGAAEAPDPAPETPAADETAADCAEGTPAGETPAADSAEGASAGETPAVDSEEGTPAGGSPAADSAEGAPAGETLGADSGKGTPAGISAAVIAEAGTLYGFAFCLGEEKTVYVRSKGFLTEEYLAEKAEELLSCADRIISPDLKALLKYAAIAEPAWEKSAGPAQTPVETFVSDDGAAARTGGRVCGRAVEGSAERTDKDAAARTDKSTAGRADDDAAARERSFLDTSVAMYLLNPLKNEYTYDDLAKDYLDLMIPSRQDLLGKLSLGRAAEEKPGELDRLACYLAYVSFAAADILRERLAENGMLALYEEVEMPLVFTLAEMEALGIRADAQMLGSYSAELGTKIEELQQKIYDQAGEEFNINSPKQLGVILFEKLHLPNGKRTKTGYSTAADVLEKLAPDYPIVADILDYRQLAKLKSTYADGLAAFISEDGRIHGTFNQTITATGRISSTDPNLQNIPIRMESGRLIRKVFLPKEGCVFLDADYSQIELRVLAHMSGDENLIEAYRNAEDIHRATASQVFHVPLEEVTPQQRRNAKAVNFGIVYGISSFGLSQDLSITRKEAQDYIERYFETYPGVKSFLDRLVADAKKKGFAETMFGRRRPVPELSSSNYMQRSFGERIAMNSPIQGTAADIIKIAMNRVRARLAAEGLQSKLILQVHDELLVETAADEVCAVKRILEEEMQGAAQLDVKLETDTKAGESWYEAH